MLRTLLVGVGLWYLWGYLSRKDPEDEADEQMRRDQEAEQTRTYWAQVREEEAKRRLRPVYKPAPPPAAPRYTDRSRYDHPWDGDDVMIPTPETHPWLLRPNPAARYSATQQTRVPEWDSYDDDGCFTAAGVTAETHPELLRPAQIRTEYKTPQPQSPRKHWKDLFPTSSTGASFQKADRGGASTERLGGGNLTPRKPHRERRAPEPIVGRDPRSPRKVKVPVLQRAVVNDAARWSGGRDDTPPEAIAARQEAVRLRKQANDLRNNKTTPENSLKVKTLRRQASVYDQQASDILYRKFNEDRNSDNVDLHGQTLREAKERVQTALEVCRQAKTSRLRLVVGQGNHSVDNVPKLKPGISGYVRDKLGLEVREEEGNGGVLWVIVV